MSKRLSIPLPRSWSRLVRRALVVAASLERVALLDARAGFEHSPDPRAHLCAALDAAHERIELLLELTRILRSRIERIPGPRRPQYPPAERLAILTLCGKAGWNKTRAARELALTPKTIASWMRRLDEQGPDALVQTRRPVNEFDDAVTELVHRLHDAAPGRGRRKTAEILLRAGLRLADSTVRRMLRRKKPRPAEPPRPPRPPNPAVTSTLGGPARVVTAKRPHHVWHIDITSIPIGLPGAGFWAAWWPFALVMRWALSWHIALVLDHYSRALIAFSVLRREPSAADICSVLDTAVVRAGAAPKQIVSDSGTQFQSDYRAWCVSHGVRPRFGAVGQHGSIALIERFILSLKDEFLRKIYVPASLATMTGALAAYQVWYNEHRPHAALDGRTPSERLAGEPAPCMRECVEPRASYPLQPARAGPDERAPLPRRPLGKLELVAGYVDGYRELPVVELREAA